MRAHVEWDGYYWVATPEGERGVTQAKRLDRLPALLSDVVKLMTGEEVPLQDWHLDIDFEDLAELRALRNEVMHKELELNRQTTETIERLRKEGFSMRDIGSWWASPTSGCTSSSTRTRDRTGEKPPPEGGGYDAGCRIAGTSPPL